MRLRVTIWTLLSRVALLIGGVLVGMIGVVIALFLPVFSAGDVRLVAQVSLGNVEVIVTQIANEPWDGFARRLYVKSTEMKGWKEFFLDNDAFFVYSSRVSKNHDGSLEVYLNGTLRAELDPSFSRVELHRSRTTEENTWIRLVKSPMNPEISTARSRIGSHHR